MSEANLEFLANVLATRLNTKTDYADWINTGIRAIVLYGVHEAKAFPHAIGLIGASADSWPSELCFVADKLRERRPLFCSALVECIQNLESDRMANDPSASEGQNLEQVAMAFLGLARDLRVAGCLQQLGGLIQVKFPRSQAIYDASLTTWRYLASFDTITDWTEVFLPPTNMPEVRYRPQYSGVLALGMCVAQPSRARFFLTSWIPFQGYIGLLVEENTAQSVAKLNQFVVAYRQVLSPTSRDTVWGFGGALGALAEVSSGRQPKFAERLVAAAALANTSPISYTLSAVFSTTANASLKDSSERILQSGMTATFQRGDRAGATEFFDSGRMTA